MKYYLPEFLEKLNHPEAPDYKETEDQWDENGNAYGKEFSKIEEYLDPKLKERLKNDFFHDCLIKKISLRRHMEKKIAEFDVIVSLKGYSYSGKLVHHRVSAFNTRFEESVPCALTGDYLYGEILRDKKGIWTHDFLFSNHNEVQVACREIEWIED